MPTEPACEPAMWQAPLRRTWWAGTVAALAWLALPGPVFADQAVPAKPVAAAPPAATPMTTPDTDQPIWRAMHRLLVGITRAGDRLVAVGNAGAILLSDDGGDSWRAARTPTDELLTAVLFPAPSEGWAVGQDGLVLHSTDAGVTWSQQHIAAGSDQALFSIAAVTPPHLIATGAYDLVLETQDGISWQDGKIPDLDDDYHLNCAVARGDDVLVTGESGHAFVRHAGTWSPMTLPYDGSQFACLLGRDGSFYSFGLRGSAFRIQPGSALWARIDLGGQQSIFGATMLADGRIALVGSNGVVRLLDPNNGGVTTLPAVGETTLSGVAEGKPGHLVAVGEDGVHVIDISASSAEARP